MQSLISPPETRFAVHGDRRNGIDRLSLVGELDRSTVPILEVEVYDVAHAGGAIVLDLRDLDAVDPARVPALEAMAQHAGQHRWWLFIVNCRDLVRDAFDGSSASDLLNEIDVSDVLAFGDGEWSPTSLPPLPGQRKRKSKRLRIVEDRP